MSNYRIFVHDFFCFIQKPEGYLYDFSWFFMFYSRSWMFYYMYLKNIHVLLHLKKYIPNFSRFFMFYSRSWIISYYILLEIYSSFINNFFKIFQDFSSYLILSDPIRSYLILSDPIWSYLILSVPIWSYLILFDPIWSNYKCRLYRLFISRCHFLRFSLFFYVLFKILIILSPIPIDYQSLVMYFTIQF